MVSVQPAQFRIYFEVANQAAVVFIVIIGKNPADVRPPESGSDRGMDIFLIVRMAMVVSVMCGPPQDALLDARLREKGHEELRRPIQFIRSMAEVTVVAGGCTERASGICDKQENYVFPAEWHKKHQDTADMQKNEGNQAVDLKSAPHK